MVVFLLILLSACFCATLVIVLRPVAIARGWVDIPQGRKQHLLSTPLTGGLAIFASLLFWLAWNKFNYVSLRSLALASALLFVIAFLTTASQFEPDIAC